MFLPRTFCVRSANLQLPRRRKSPPNNNCSLLGRVQQSPPKLHCSPTYATLSRVLFGGVPRHKERVFRQHLCGWPSDLPPATEWGYLRGDGPSTWHEKYPEAGGDNQSPVDIKTPAVQSSNEVKDQPLTRSYGSEGISKSILNSGQGWRVDVQEGVTGLSGGPLQHKYELVQFHCHWGDVETCGSEHTVDGKPHVGELHFVHWNKDLYSKCSDAVSGPRGLCVIAVFLELGESNPEVEKICSALKDIPYRDQRTDMPKEFDINKLFPDDNSYWSYDGSLTTPPCYESVTWIVLKKPISVSSSQLEIFRTLHTYSENEDIPPGEFKGKVLLNYRPPQDLNDRIILDCPFDN